MSFEFVANVALGGLLTGLVYALMALGLSVIFGVIKVVNFAHGEMAVLAMFAAFLLYQATGVDPVYAIPVVAGGLFAVGYAMQIYLVAPFVTRPQHEQFILLLAVAVLTTNGLLIIFGPDARGVILDYSFDSYAVGPLIIDKTKAIAAGTAFFAAMGLLAFFRFTRTGKAIRACADNLTGAQVVGMNVQRLYALTFGIGLAGVGVAGCLLILVVEATPALGPELTLLAFIIVIVGGLGSLAGALVGGVLIGLSEALAGIVLSPSMKSMFSFALLILILAVRPEGLLGKRRA